MKKTIVLFFAALFAVLSVSSCKKDQTETASAKAEPVVFRVLNAAEPNSLDPHKIQGVIENRIYQGLFEGLVAYDPQTAAAVPGVAESWTVSDDNTVYTFKLRDVSWSDGVKITAHTVVESWLRELAPETAAVYAWFPAMFIKGASEYNASGETNEDGSLKFTPAEIQKFKEAVGVKALDDRTLEVTLVGPMPYALDAMAHYSFAITPTHAIEKFGDSWTNVENIVTNGPFKLKEWTPQEKVVIVKNPDYWDAENVQLDEIIYYPVDDNNTAYNMFINGEADWMTEIPADKIKEALLRDDSVIAPMLGAYYYSVNTKVPGLSDVRVRKALSMAIDRQLMVDRVTQGGEIPTAAMVPTMNGYDALQGNILNIKKAKELLADAGYPDGEGFPEFTILYNTNDNHKKLAEFIQSQWLENLGINVKLENQEWKTYLNSRNQHDFQIARAGWIGDYQDPNTFLDMWVTGGSMNDAQYENPQYDAFIKQASEMKAGAERFEVLRQAEILLVKEDQALIPLYSYVTKNMIDTEKWGGWYANTLDLHPVKRVYKK